MNTLFGFYGSEFHKSQPWLTKYAMVCFWHTRFKNEGGIFSPSLPWTNQKKTMGVSNLISFLACTIQEKKTGHRVNRLFRIWFYFCRLSFFNPIATWGGAYMPPQPLFSGYDQDNNLGVVFYTLTYKVSVMGRF